MAIDKELRKALSTNPHGNIKHGLEIMAESLEIMAKSVELGAEMSLNAEIFTIREQVLCSICRAILVFLSS